MRLDFLSIIGILGMTLVLAPPEIRAENSRVVARIVENFEPIYQSNRTEFMCKKEIFSYSFTNSERNASSKIVFLRKQPSRTQFKLSRSIFDGRKILSHNAVCMPRGPVVKFVTTNVAGGEGSEKECIVTAFNSRNEVMVLERGGGMDACE